MHSDTRCEYIRIDLLHESIRIHSVSQKVEPVHLTTTSWSLYAEFTNYDCLHVSPYRFPVDGGKLPTSCQLVTDLLRVCNREPTEKLVECSLAYTVLVAGIMHLAVMGKSQIKSQVQITNHLQK